MMRLAIATVLLAASVAAQPVPEECIAKGEVSVTHGGKTYRLANDACREQFLSDPERYAQLYDALLELQAEGAPIAPARASLVPS
jgi:YHS domain-containing protein